MNLLLFEPDEIGDDNTVSFQDRRSTHLISILGCSPGDTIRAGVINGPAGTGEILSVMGRGKGAKVVLRFTAGKEVGHEPPIDLILGMVRPIMLKRVLRQVASLGVGEIFLINSNRVEKSFFEASLLQDKQYRAYLLEGLEQARDTRLPHLSVHRRFRPFVEDFIPTLAEKYGQLLVAHPEAGTGVRVAAERAPGARTLLAVGPEGGWIDYEVEKFVSRGFTPVSMGPRVLRTDTAVVALLAQLMVLERGR